MGVDLKKKKAIPLPAPTETTESTTTTTTTSSTATDAATDVSRPNDEKSSYSLPEDGTPVTIKTRGHSANRSQTSLLIEYFEGGKGTGSESPVGRKPSVRVRLKPSGSGRKNDRIMISKPKSTSSSHGRKTSASYRSSSGRHHHKSSSSAAADRATATREIDLSTGDVTHGEGGEDDKSISSYASATEESNVSRNPIVVEIDRSGSAGSTGIAPAPQRSRVRRPTSPLIPTAATSSRGSASYGPGTQSEISAIPADSFLDGSKSTGRSESPARHFAAAAAATAAAAAGAAAVERNRVPSGSKSRGIIEEKERAVFKSSSSKDKDRGSRDRTRERERDRDIREGSSSVKSKRRSSGSRNSSTHGIDRDDISSPTHRRSSRHRPNEPAISGPDSSIVSSALSPSHRSYDQYSVRSGASKTSSINNPKLLETVEDAIRRLILPELNALKREHSRKDRRGSTTSTATGTSLSRDDYAASDRRKSGTSDRVPSSTGVYSTTTKSREIRDREGRHDLEGSLSPAGDYVYESGEDQPAGVATTSRSLGETPTRSSDKLKTTATAGAAGIALGGLAAAAMAGRNDHNERNESPLSAREQRRRRREGARDLLEGRVSSTTTTTTQNPPDVYVSGAHDDGSTARSFEEDSVVERGFHPESEPSDLPSDLSPVHTFSEHQPQLHQEQQQRRLEPEPSYLQPPMPLMSEINSDVTRSSILSAETDRPRSASEELQATPIHEVPRSIPSIGSGLGSASTPTPTTTPAATLQALGAQHANISHGDLRALPRKGLSAEYPEDEDSYDGEELEHEGDYIQQRGLDPQQQQQQQFSDQYGHDGVDDDYDDDYEDEMAQYGAQTYDAYGHQIVPAPLKYVPYQPEHRGLSPIPSVSGYTEGGASEHQGYRDSILTTTTGGSSPGKSPRLERKTAAASPSSIPSNIMGREFDQDGSSVHSSDMAYRASTHLTDADFRAVNGAAANPNFVHTPIGVESAVASLVDSSVADGSGLTADSSVGGYGQQQQNSRSVGQMGPLEEELSHGQITPTRTPTRHYSAEPQQRGLTSDDVFSEGHSSREVGNRDMSGGSPTTTRTNPSEFAGEYEIDQYGRKVRRSSPTASEAAAITAGAVGLAIQAARDRNQQPGQTKTLETREISGAPPATEEWVPAGVQRNKSFKERTLDGRQPANTPTHSIDRLDEYGSPALGASGLPDLSNPMPEIGFGYQDDDLETNPSVVHNRDVGFDKDDWRSADRTPTQEHPKNASHGFGPVTGAAAGAAAAAAFASSQHSRQPSQEREEEWQRSSDERKRDTLITNPYEGTSPVVNESLIKNALPGAPPGAPVGAAAAYGAAAEYTSRSPMGNRYDEGYISQGPGKSPDMTGAAKGKGIDFVEPLPTGYGGQEDPFYNNSQARHFSGLSQGMPTPLYDAATGAGIDRIENKDIIALMQHLMVRDAQRSARDTEILVTLVRSAAEMRTSFENVRSMLATHEKSMSNDFSKKLADSEDAIITEVLEGTEKSIRTLGGPRPLPGSGSRSLAAGGSQADMDDYPAKRQNIFRRALKSLNAKGNTDLGRIEDMLNQLLIQVDMLKAQSAGGPGDRALSASGSTSGGHGPSPYEGLIEGHLSSFDQDRGYEPEGRAGTSTASHGSQSGFLSVNSRGGPSTSAKLSDYDRKFTGNRISTVVEANEDDLQYTHQGGGGGISMTSPRATSSGNLQYDNSASVPRMTSAILSTTPDPHTQLIQEQQQQQQQQQQRQLSDPQLLSPVQSIHQQAINSAENTPKTDKGKRHKSGGSNSWLPKISRWSETTTSSVGRVFRSSRDSKRDELGYHSGPPSRSGSDLGDDYGYEPEGGDKLHSGFSETDLHRSEYYGSPQHDAVHGGFHVGQGSAEAVDRPNPSTYMTPEDPKYHAHRDSLNLQHPQPRSGQPFKATLESRAADFDSPTSPRSADWAGSATSLHRLPGQNTNRYSDQSGVTNSSAAAANAAAREAQRQYWAASPASGKQSPQVAPPRPPKEPLLEGDQLADVAQDSRSVHTPSRSRLTKPAPKSSPLPFHSVESGYGTATNVPTSYTGSPRLENRNLSGALAVPNRRPSGPRAMTPKSEKSVRSFTEEDAVSPATDARRRKRDTFGTIASQESDAY